MPSRYFATVRLATEIPSSFSKFVILLSLSGFCGFSVAISLRIFARTEVEDRRMAAEAARMTMMTRRSEHDELRREAEDRAKRLEAIGAEVTSWKNRAETAGTRIAELQSRVETSGEELEAARGKPAELEAARERLSDDIDGAETRRKGWRRAKPRFGPRWMPSGRPSARRRRRGTRGPPRRHGPKARAKR